MFDTKFVCGAVIGFYVLVFRFFWVLNISVFFFESVFCFGV